MILVERRSGGRNVTLSRSTARPVSRTVFAATVSASPPATTSVSRSPGMSSPNKAKVSVPLMTARPLREPSDIIANRMTLSFCMSSRTISSLPDPIVQAMPHRSGRCLEYQRDRRCRPAAPVCHRPPRASARREYDPRDGCVRTGQCRSGRGNSRGYCSPAQRGMATISILPAARASSAALRSGGRK